MLGNFSSISASICLNLGAKRKTVALFLTATEIFYVLNSFQLTQKQFSKFFKQLYRHSHKENHCIFIRKKNEKKIKEFLQNRTTEQSREQLPPTSYLPRKLSSA